MIFKTWKADLSKIYGAYKSIKNIDIEESLSSDNVESLSSAISGLNRRQAKLALLTKLLTKEQMDQVLIKADLIASEDRIQAELLQSALAHTRLSKAQQQGVLDRLKLINWEAQAVDASKSCTKAELQKAFEAEKLTGANFDAALSALGFATANKGLAGSFGALAASVKNFFAANPIAGFTMMGTAVWGVVNLLASLPTAVERARDSLEDSKSAYDSTTTKIEGLEQELADCNKRMRELEEGKGIQNLVDDAEYQKLKRTNEELQRAIDLKKIDQSMEAEEVLEDASKLYHTKVPSQYDKSFAAGGSGVQVSNKVSVKEEFDLAAADYKKNQKIYEDYNKQIDSKLAQSSKLEKGTEERKKLEAEIKRLEGMQQLIKEDQINKAKARAKEMKDIAQQVHSAMQDIIDHNGSLSREEQQLLGESEVILNHYAKTFENTVSSITEKSSELPSAFQNISAISKDTLDSVDKIVRAFTTLSSLNGQSVSMEQFSSEELKEYHSALEYVNGAMEINIEKARELALAKAEEALNTLEASKAQEKAAYLGISKQIETYTAALGNKNTVMYEGELISRSVIDSLEQQREQIIENCSGYDLLAMNIRKASGTYQAWLDSQNVQESGTMFTDAGNAAQAIQEGLSSGKIGTQKYKAAVEFLVPHTIDSSDQNAVRQYLKTLETYLADNGSGVNRFIQDALENGLIESTGDRTAKIASGKTIQDFAETLEITQEMARAVFGELGEYGWEIDWSAEWISSSEDMVYYIRSQMDELSAYIEDRKSVGIDTSEAEQKLNDLKETYHQTTNELAQGISEKLHGASENGQENEIHKLAADLEAAEQKLNVLKFVPFSSLFGLGSVKQTVSDLQRELYETLELNPVKIQAYIEVKEKELQSLDPSSEKYKEVSQELELIRHLSVTLTPETQESGHILEDIQSKMDILSKGGHFTITANAETALMQLNALQIAVNALKGEHSVKVPQFNFPKLNLPKTNVPLFEPPQDKKYPSLGLIGIACASGSPGTSKTERALVGELGREIIADTRTGRWHTVGDNGAEFVTIPRGSIVFNHQQTEKLLKRGFVNERGMLTGSSYTSGTSYASGISYAPGDFSGSFSGQTAAGTGKVFDWIEHLQKILERKQKDLESQSSSSFLSYLGLTGDEFTQAQEILSRTTQPMGEDLQKLTDIASSAGISLSQLMDILAAGGHDSRRGAFDALLKLDEREIEAGKQSIEKYKQQFEEAAETLSPDILNKILDGGLNIESYPEQEAEKIQNVISLFDKWKNAEADLRESEKKRKEDILAGYDNRAEAFDKEIELSENHNDYINAEIKYLEESGQLVNASSYETILANLQHQEALLEKKLALRRKQLQALLDSGEIEEGSEEYYQLQGYIDDCEESLVGLETQQEEYNNKLLHLPIENMDTILDMYRSIQEEIESWGNVLEASGQKLDSQYYQTLIDNGMELISQYQEQAELVRDVMNEYETGSDQWNKLYSRLTDIGSSISSMTQNLHEWNEELLRMPLASMSTFTDELNKVLDSLNRIQDDYDTVISAVTSSIRDYRESLQKANEADNEAYQSRIDGLQEQLDLLNKQNEQLRLQTSYEQALYDLQTANTQKTERVIRNGEIVYETNADNLRNAKESVQNALADLEEYKMRSEIDNLGDILDGINEKYNDQIEALDKISEKWEKIASDTEKAADYAVASEYLGNNWQEKITSGNDLDLYTAFKSSYESNADNIHTYKEQITATENIYTLLEEYINSYREGTLTYEQAMKGIQGLLSQMNQVMSSGQNLQNVLDYLSLTNGTDSDTAAVLEGIQKSLSESSDELLENMKQYNENLDLIAGCMTSWETLVDNTNQMVDLLEEVRDNLEDALDEIGRQIREKEEDDDDDRDSGRYTTNGGTAPRHDKNDWGSDTEGPGVKHSSKGSSESAGVETYGDGIKKGLVGRSGPSAREDMLKTLAGRELDPKEFPALLHYHEAVFNEEQQALLIKNLTGAYAAVPDMPFPDCTGKLFYNVPKYTPSPTNNYQVSISDVNVQGVKNVEDFINSMATLSSQALRQQFSKGF